MKVRIIERISPCGERKFVIQQRHSWFRWMWVDAWINSLDGAMCNDTFDTYEQALNNLCFFDGTRSKERILISK